jgi:hypothetical protein
VVRDQASERKLRLFACACCRRLSQLLAVEQNSNNVETAELFADGRATNSERRSAAKRGYVSADINLRWGECAAASALAVSGSRAADQSSTAARYFAVAVVGIPQHIQGIANPAWQERFEQEGEPQAVLLRDIFGNPFRSMAFADMWRTETVGALARQMYESRDFSAMPILADALQDAGCDSADILDHCRGGGPHVRGCWVVDLVLGKE